MQWKKVDDGDRTSKNDDAMDKREVAGDEFMNFLVNPK